MTLAMTLKNTLLSDKTLKVMQLLNEEAIPLTSAEKIETLRTELATAARGKAMVMHVTVPDQISARMETSEAKSFGNNMADIANILAEAMHDELSIPVIRVASNVVQEESHDAPDADLSALVKSYLVAKDVSNTIRDQKGNRVLVAHDLQSLNYNIAMHKGDHLASAPIIALKVKDDEATANRLSVLKNVKNVIQINVDSETQPDRLDKILHQLNKEAIPGKLMVVFAMGAKNVDTRLGKLLDVVKDHGDAVLSLCNPSIENNTLDEMKQEAISFTNQCIDKNMHPGGLKLTVDQDNLAQRELINELVMPVSQNQVRAVTNSIMRRRVIA